MYIQNSSYHDNVCHPMPDHSTCNSASMHDKDTMSSWNENTKVKIIFSVRKPALLLAVG